MLHDNCKRLYKLDHVPDRIAHLCRWGGSTARSR